MVGDRLRVTGRVCRAGNVQLYEQGDGTILREYRPPEEIFDAESLASMHAIPLTIQHPKKTMVTADNWRRLAHGNMGDDARPDDDRQHVLSTLWIHDRKAIDAVLAEELVELSLGYFASLDMAPGVSPEGQQYDAIQRGHRYNHLALLKEGQARGGPTVRIQDGVPVMRLDSNGDALIDSTEHETPARAGEEEPSMKFVITVDGVDYQVEAPDQSVAQALAKERAAEAKAIADANARADAAEAERDAAAEKATGLEAERDELKTKLDAATDPSVIAQAAAELAAVVADARTIAGDEFVAEGDASSIRRAALVKASVVVDGKSDAYVEARFDGLVDAAKAKTDADKAVKSNLADARGAATAPKGTDHEDSAPRMGSLTDVALAVLDGREEI